jgi:mRNA interferase MazF
MNFKAGDVVAVGFIATLPPSANFVYVGHLSDRDWQGVCACVKVSFDRSTMEN